MCRTPLSSLPRTDGATVGLEGHGLSGRVLIHPAQYLVDRVSSELVKYSEQTLYVCSCFVSYFTESVDPSSSVHVEIRPKPHSPFQLRSDSPLLLLTTGQDSYQLLPKFRTKDGRPSVTCGREG